MQDLQNFELSMNRTMRRSSTLNGVHKLRRFIVDKADLYHLFFHNIIWKEMTTTIKKTVKLSQKGCSQT